MFKPVVTILKDGDQFKAETIIPLEETARIMLNLAVDFIRQAAQAELLASLKSQSSVVGLDGRPMMKLVKAGDNGKKEKK